jgi:hypothetical protein
MSSLVLEVTLITQEAYTLYRPFKREADAGGVL